jgi:hypothetical protein
MTCGVVLSASAREGKRARGAGRADGPCVLLGRARVSGGVGPSGFLFFFFKIVNSADVYLFH